MTSTATAPTRTASVLIIEDHPDIASSLARFLQVAFDHQVDTAADGPEGVRKALDGHPDVVVCDIGLPKRNGILVGEELAQTLTPKPLLVAVTGYGDEATRELAAGAGFDHFLTKPASPFAIAALIEAHLARAGGDGFE